MNTFRKLLKLLSIQQKRASLLLVILMLVGAGLETLSVASIPPVVSIIQGKIDHVWLKSLAAFLVSKGIDLGIFAVLFLVFVFLIKLVFLANLAYKQASFAFRLQADVSARLFKGYLSRSFEFHVQNNSAQLIRNTINETNQFTFGAVLPALVLITEVFVLMGVVCVLFLYEPAGALLVIVLGGAMGYLFSRLTRRMVGQWGARRHYHEGLRIQHIQQGLGGVKEIKLSGRENYFFKQYDVHNTESAKTGELQTAMQSLPRLLLEFTAIVVLAVSVVFSNLAGKSAADLIPVFGLFSIAAFRLVPSANRILGALQSIRYSIAGLDVLVNEINACEVPSEPTKALADIKFNNQIDLNTVSYSYSASSPMILDAVSLQIRKGTTIGIVGESGSGKSTLVNVLLGLLDPKSGEVLVDGLDVACNLRMWQDSLGYVPQTIYLTDDSLKRNVAFGIPDSEIDDGKVMRALELAQLLPFLQSLPNGLDEPMGERGVRLSGGQRQRIGIARALYDQPDLLILDEATSALDNETEREAMLAISGLHGKITILIVAHRISTLAQCDSIFRLEKGKLRQVAYQELL